MDPRERAKRLLLHYMELLAKAAGLKLDFDCRAEIEEIVDDIIDAARRDTIEQLSSTGD